MNNLKNPAITIVGPGRVGIHLAVLLARNGWSIEQVAGRDRNKLDQAARRLQSESHLVLIEELNKPAEVLLLTVSDDAIGAVCEQLAGQGALDQGTVVFHTSGACASDLLEPARCLGAAVGSMHPLQTFMESAAGIPDIGGTHWFFEGSARAGDLAARITASLGGLFHVIESEKKVLYHASAAIACNYMNAVLSAALDCAQSADIPRQDMMAALRPLVTTTVENMFNTDPASALTGPISRGDVETVNKHLEAMAHSPDLRSLYQALGRIALEMARSHGMVDESEAKRLAKSLAQTLESEG